MNKKDLQIIAKNIKDEVCDSYNLKDISIKVKKIKRGRAIYRSRFISIPVWAYSERNIYHFKYYILHELSHFINYDKNNGSGGYCKKFKDIEKKLLYKYKMIPIYNRAYAKILLDLNENILWDKCKTLYELSNSLHIKEL